MDGSRRAGHEKGMTVVLLDSFWKELTKTICHFRRHEIRMRTKQEENRVKMTGISVIYPLK